MFTILAITLYPAFFVWIRKLNITFLTECKSEFKCLKNIYAPRVHRRGSRLPKTPAARLWGYSENKLSW